MEGRGCDESLAVMFEKPCRGKILMDLIPYAGGFSGVAIPVEFAETVAADEEFSLDLFPDDPSAGEVVDGKVAVITVGADVSPESLVSAHLLEFLAFCDVVAVIPRCSVGIEVLVPNEDEDPASSIGKGSVRFDRDLCKIADVDAPNG